MKHIAFLIPTIDQIGGAESQVLLLAKALAERDWTVTLVALSGDGNTMRKELADANVSYLSLGMRKAWIDPRGWVRYLRWAGAHRPDILHAHLPHATFFARLVRLVLPVRVVLDTIHTSRPADRGRRFGYRMTAWLSDHTTCVSHSVVEAGIARCIVQRQKVSTLYNGVMLPKREDAGLCSESQAGSGAFRWVAIGRLASVKDFSTLLRAFATMTLQEAAPPPALTIVGSGPEERTLKQLAAQLSIASRVDFAGFQKNIAPFLANADAFVLSSLWEGLPVSVLEAQAAGLPIVATDVPGTRESLRRGISGVLVPSADPAALAFAMAAMTQMPVEARRAMGEHGRQFITQTFDLNVIVDQWMRLYLDLLHRNAEPNRRG